MKTKRFSLLLLLSLLMLFSACAEQKTETPENSVVSMDLELSGIGVDLPGRFGNLNGVLVFEGGDEIVEGVYFTDLVYYAMPAETYEELMWKNRSSSLTKKEYNYLSARVRDLLVAFTADGSRTLEEIADSVAVTGLSADNCQSIGSAGEFRYYGIFDPLLTLDGFDEGYAFADEYQAEFDALLDLLKQDPSVFRFYEPKRSEAEESGISFAATDLDGNTVSSEDVFGSHTLTMVNLWGTYCGPCIREMPELEVLNGRLKEKNCAVIGVVIDVSGADDEEMIRTAREILSEAGASYLNLVPWDGLRTDLPSTYIPTTYFIDENGNVVGDPVIGAHSADEYEALIDERLSSLLSSAE
ncbi:MAG: TlpA family protein disulfide reductase [Clostridia bacterium]|nr:TlpA family protein disulfide reductase [Clostridia bacterium]